MMDQQHLIGEYSSPPRSSSIYMEEEDGQGVARNPESFQLGALLLFPNILYEMLNDAEEAGFEHIVSWGKDPNAFNVHKKKQFESEILSKYFKMTKYKSFTRQLHNYGFIWVRNGPDKGGYCHHNFSRENERKRSKPITRKQRMVSKQLPLLSFDLHRNRGLEGLSRPITIHQVRDLQRRSNVVCLDKTISPATSSLTCNLASFGRCLECVPYGVNELTKTSEDQNECPFIFQSSRRNGIAAGGFLPGEKLFSPKGFYQELEGANTLEPRTIDEMLGDTEHVNLSTSMY